MTVGRRTVWRGALAAAGAAALGGIVTGCGPSKEEIGTDLSRAAESVDGVESVQARYATYAESPGSFIGTATIAAESRDELLRIYDEAVGAVVRRIAEAEYGKYTSLLDFVGSNGSQTVTLRDLEPSIKPDSRKYGADLLFPRYRVS